MEASVVCSLCEAVTLLRLAFKVTALSDTHEEKTVAFLCMNCRELVRPKPALRETDAP